MNLFEDLSGAVARLQRSTGASRDVTPAALEASLRRRLAEAEHRADLAEAVAAERDRVILSQERVLRSLGILDGGDPSGNRESTRPAESMTESGANGHLVEIENQAAIIAALRAGGMPVNEVAQRLGVSSRTVYRRSS